MQQENQAEFTDLTEVDFGSAETTFQFLLVLIHYWSYKHHGPIPDCVSLTSLCQNVASDLLLHLELPPKSPIVSAANLLLFACGIRVVCLAESTSHLRSLICI